jgi:drug/metabolite transporter (DMT)-like permease
LINKEGIKKVVPLAYLCLFIVSIGWGITWVIAKMALEYMPPLQMSGIRQLIAAFGYIVFFGIAKNNWLPPKESWKGICILALLNFVFANGFSTWGVLYIPSGIGSVIGTLYPIWVIILSSLFFKDENINKQAYWGIAISFLGIIIIFWEKLWGTIDANYFFGLGLSLFAAFAWALGSIYTKKNAVNYNPYQSLGWQMGISGLILTITSWINGKHVSLVNLPIHFWIDMSLLLIIGNLLCFVCYIYMLQKMPAAQASVYAYINPVVALIGGSIFLHEVIDGYILWGSAITILGVLWVQYIQTYKNRKTKELQ